MPDSDERPLDQAGTREKILAAAEQLIATRGLDGFQLKDVAEAVGIRPPSVYAHFDGREAIADAVALRFYRALDATLRIGSLQEADPIEAIRAIVGRATRLFASHPGYLRLVLRDSERSAFPVSSGPSQAWLDIALQWDSVIERGVAQGVFRSVRRDAAQAQIVGAILHNLCWEGFDAEGNPLSGAPLDQVVRESQEMAVRLLVRSPDDANNLA